MREKCPQKFIQSRDERTQKKEKKPARLKTQKGGLGKSQGQRKKKKKRETCKAENPKRRSRQKLGPKKRKEGKSHQVGNLKMQSKKRRILQDESLEV